MAVFEKSLTKTWKPINLGFMGLIILIDLFIPRINVSYSLVINYFYQSIGLAVVVAMIQFIVGIYFFFKSDTRRGLFYIFNAVIWLGMSFLIFVIHSFLIWTTPSVNVD